MYGINVTIFDMNKMIVEKQKSIYFLEFFEKFIEENKSSKSFFKKIGLEINGIKFNLENTNKFVLYIISELYPDYEIINTNGKELGHPDFILKNKIYLELKMGSDSLRMSQLKWFIDNKDKTNKVLHLDFTPTVNELEVEKKLEGDFL